VSARWKVYGIAVLAVLLVASHLYVYFQGVEANPYITVSRSVPKWSEAKSTKRWKKAKKVTVPCVNVRAVVPNDHSQPLGPRPSGDLVGTSKSDITFPLLLGEWELDPMPWGGTAQATLDESGDTHLATLPNARPFLEVGRLREFAAWYGLGPMGSTWALSYQQDILRLGPAWLRGRAEFGKIRSDYEPTWKAELGVAFRF